MLAACDKGYAGIVAAVHRADIHFIALKSLIQFAGLCVYARAASESGARILAIRPRIHLWLGFSVKRRCQNIVR